MNKPCKNMILAALFAAITATAAAQTALAPVGQWDFEQGNLSATLGDDLQYADGPSGLSQSRSVFGTTASLSIPSIAGTNANVLSFPAYTNGMGLQVIAPATGNGGGTLVNNYTIIFDLYYPAGSDHTVRPLIQTDDGTMTGNKTAVYIGANNGIGSSSGSLQGTVLPNTWYRIGLVFNSDAGVLQKYVNGMDVGDQSIGGADLSFALVPGANILILGNNDTNAAPGFVNCVQMWDVALNPGQMLALGSAKAAGIPSAIPPIPAYIASRSPAPSATGVSPQPTIQVELQGGDTTISQSSIALYMDGSRVNATIGAVSGGYSISYGLTNILAPSSPHTVSLVFQNNTLGTQTNSWSFTVARYQNVTLPAPIYLETFDELAEGALPDGWTVTNRTELEADHAGFNLSDPDSDAYLDFVVINGTRLGTTFNPIRLQLPFIVLNGVVLDSLVHGNLLYAESDQRSGSQVNVAFTKDYDLTGKTNVFVSWKCTYEQNQDNIGSVEYSVDQGATWLPVIYYFDPDGDLITDASGAVDVFATFGTARNDQSYGLAYSNFIAAVVSTNLAPYVQARINDDVLDAKRIEVVRIPQADGQSHVRFRFGQAGTASWYFGIDDFGLYSINTPIITSQPQSQTIDEGSAFSVSVAASSPSAATYQWQFNGRNITGATNATFSIANVAVTDAGLYSVIVSNNDGPATSDSAVLTVVSVPQIVTSPLSQWISAEATVTLNGLARGGKPISYYWLFNGTLLSAPNSTNLVINNIQLANGGSYAMIASNIFGMATSAVAQVNIVTNVITDGLVAHLKFDGDYNDATANMVNGHAMGDVPFETGILGQAVHLISTTNNSINNYLSLGYPDVLKFGTNNFSVAFWAKINAQWDDKPFICTKNWNSGGNPGWVVSTEGGGMKWNIDDTVNSGRRDSATVAPQLLDHTWHQVTVTFDRAGLGKIYVDGILMDNTSMAPDAGVAIGSLDTDALGLSINLGQDGTGNYTDSGKSGVDFLMDDLGIWTRVITGQEAASIFVQGKTGKDLTTASGKPVALPPGIDIGPMSQVVSVGRGVSFTVTPTGTAPFTYQWFKNGTAINNATNSTLSLTAGASDEGDYTVTVSNASGFFTSTAAHLMVYSGPITQDLMVHLAFDGDYSDSSGRGNNATAVGAPTFAQGKIGQAMSYTTLKDGSSFNYAKLGAPSDLLFGTNSFSVSFWVNYTNQSDDLPFISNKDWNSSGNKGWGIFTQGGGNFRVNATGPSSTGKFDTTLSPVIRDGTWHMLTVTFWRGQAVHIYLDGALLQAKAITTEGSFDTDDTGKSINIGQDGTGAYTDKGSAQVVNGLIDDVGIWGRVLTDQEVADIFAAAQSGQDLTLGGGLPKLAAAVVNNTIQLHWAGSANTQLQTSPTIGVSATWANVPNTLGASSANVPVTGQAAFFRLIISQ